MPNEHSSRFVEVKCSEGHRFGLPAESVRITHTRNTVLGIEFPCGACSSVVEVGLPAQTLAMLAELGVRPGEVSRPDDHEPIAVNDCRRSVSATLLGGATLVPSHIA